MIGSEKQVAWASKIKAEYITSVESEIESIRQRVANYNEDDHTLTAAEFSEKADERLEKLARILVNAAAEDRAAWWIDHRNSGTAFFSITFAK